MERPVEIERDGLRGRTQCPVPLLAVLLIAQPRGQGCAGRDRPVRFSEQPEQILRVAETPDAAEPGQVDKLPEPEVRAANAPDCVQRPFRRPVEHSLGRPVAPGDSAWPSPANASRRASLAPPVTVMSAARSAGGGDERRGEGVDVDPERAVQPARIVALTERRSQPDGLRRLRLSVHVGDQQPRVGQTSGLHQQLRARQAEHVVVGVGAHHRSAIRLVVC